MRSSIVVVALCALALASCAKAGGRIDPGAARKTDMNEVYAAVIEDLEVYGKADLTGDVDFYNYRIPQGARQRLIDGVGRQKGRVVEAIAGYGLGSDVKLGDTIIPKSMKLLPKGFCYQFSRVGFSGDGSVAIVYVYVSNSQLCNADVLYVLEKENGTWRIVTEVF